MTELAKAAEAREIDICQYSTNNCLNTNDCHRCQWGVPSLDLRCSNNASFKLGAKWQAEQSPWISVEERLPEKDKNVLLKVKNCGVLIGLGMNVKDSSLDITHWCTIPE